MKTLIALAIALVSVSCVSSPAEWDDTANPLDAPVTYVHRPESMGHFGPHSEYYR